MLIFLFLATIVNSQDLTGIWRGSFVSSSKILNFSGSERYKLEVQIDQFEKSFNSVTYSYRTTMFYGKATAKGTFNPKSGMVWLEEIKIVEIKMISNSSACIMTYRMKYSKNNDEEFLEGTWKGYEENDSTKMCGQGTVLLHKVPASDFHEEPFLSKTAQDRKKRLLASRPKLNTDTSLQQRSVATSGTKIPPAAKPAAPVAKVPGAKINTPPSSARVTPVKPPAGNTIAKNRNPPKTGTPVPPTKNVEPIVPKPLEQKPGITETDTLRKAIPQIKKAPPLTVPRVLATRENEVIKTITINTNEISINIYDNGTIDHDTVSVYFDKKLVISKQMLRTTPINFKFAMDDDNDIHELIMVAENEGDIPPNTSLMVVKAGDKEYEVRITSTEQKNAVIIFKYEK